MAQHIRQSRHRPLHVGDSNVAHMADAKAPWGVLFQRAGDQNASRLQALTDLRRRLPRRRRNRGQRRRASLE